MFSIILLFFILGMIKYSLNFKNLLSSLITLEFMVSLLMVLMFWWMHFLNYEMMFFMLFITLSVCEGVIGISLLILMIRNFNNCYFQSLNLLSC